MGCGSVSLCQQLIQITSTVGDEVLFGWRSFEIYPLQVRTAGATPVQVPLTDYTYDLDAMLAAITDRTRLIFVCNPNNPTSTVVDPDALARFVEAVPSHILIALDEAYVEYIRDGLLPDSFGLVRKHSNVVVLRTFSKAYGLAGLRIGYAVGDPDIITALGKVYVPFTATSISQAAAIASLDAADELLARTDAVVAERARVTAALRDAGYTVPPSQANFVWLPLPGRAQDFANDSANSRVIVRPYGEDGVRVTVAAPHENDAFLAFAQRMDRRALARLAAGVGDQPVQRARVGGHVDRIVEPDIGAALRGDDRLGQTHHVVGQRVGRRHLTPGRLRVIPSVDQEFDRQDAGHDLGGRLVRSERHRAVQAAVMPRVQRRSRGER